MLSPDQIEANYKAVLERVVAAAKRAGRPPEAVRLVVVTKGHPAESVQAVVRAGAGRLGENYVEEALPKIRALAPAPAQSARVEWHMIGHVQSRKAGPVSQQFDWLHSLDRAKLANRLDRFAGEAGQVLPVLLECNVSGEASKYGWQAWQEGEWDRLAGEIGPLLDLKNISVRGLMTMAPFSEDAETARPVFQRLRRLQAFLAERYPQADWRELSMGMSADFEVAIQEGATLVRIGTAIMGARPE